MNRPKGTVIRGMHFLQADHMRRVITEKTEEKGAFVGVGYTRDIKEHDRQGNIECGSLNRYQTRRVRKETGGDREAGEKRASERGRPEPEAETSKGRASGERNWNPR